MTDAVQRLSVALADRYVIERELGAGGMATVYLAHDVRHDRKVALKVLRPELSAILGGERFLAEIKTTANLQHPHILSLFDSGEADGLVFYVMPYVEGESLRDRLTREKQLPVDEAVRIAREVADALDYAHQHGIVHRDIKPENILLHGGHAMVADFGIALAASRSEGGTRMTETGMSLGTPHYMSPEQAMGERGALLRPGPASPNAVGRFSLQLPAEAPLGTAGGSIIAMAPDGSRIVYVGVGPSGNQLFLRGLDQLQPVPLAGTQGASSPFFSYDGQWIAFFAGNKLVKVPLSGGPALAVATTAGVGGSWGPGDTIVFSSDSGLMQVPAAGGMPRVLLRADSGQGAYMYPEYLPNGRALLFYTRRGDEDHFAALDLHTGKVKRFEQVGFNPHYVSTGHVVLATRTGTVIAVPFDAARLAVTGSPLPVAEDVVIGGSGAAKMGVSRDGDFAYQVGQAGVAELAMVDRAGAVRPLPTDAQAYLAPRLSPDGRRVAVQVAEQGSPNTDVWVYDIAQKTRTRLTFDQSGQRPIWTPDGRRIVYSRGPNGNADLAWIPADGSGPAESLLTAPDDQWPGAFTPDGRTLAFRSGAGAATKRTLHVLPMDGSRQARPLLVNQFDNHSPSLSPDGQWVAYVSDESGRPEIYVRPFPGPGGRWQVSLDGGTEPRWSPAGREIFYRTGNRMMAASVVTRPTFSVGERRLLFEANYANLTIHTNYDVSRDGRSFLMVRPTRDTQGFVVVLNWFRNLGRDARAARGAGVR